MTIPPNLMICLKTNNAKSDQIKIYKFDTIVSRIKKCNGPKLRNSAR